MKKSKSASAAPASAAKRAKKAEPTVDAVEEQEYTPTWADDEETPFPRGGGTELSALEYKAIVRSAQEDAVIDQQEEAEPGSSKRPGTKWKGAEDGEYDATAVSRSETGSSLIKAHALHRKLCVPGLKLLGAVSDVSTERIIMQLPGRMVGRVARAEVSDELSALAAEGGQLPDLRKLFRLTPPRPVQSLSLLRILSHPVSPRPILSQPIPAHPIASSLFPSYPIPTHPISSHPTPPHPIPPHPVPSHSIPVPSHPLPSHPSSVPPIPELGRSCSASASRSIRPS